MAQYRVVDTTDHRHRGVVVEFDPASPSDIVLGSMVIETLSVRQNEDGTVTVGDPNYIVTLAEVE